MPSWPHSQTPFPSFYTWCDRGVESGNEARPMGVVSIRVVGTLSISETPAV